ncbi:2OG-Fe(II) oxygenase [Streptomyces sp. NPDC003832]
MTDLYESKIDETLRFWDRRGFSVVRGLFSDAETTVLRQALEREISREREPAPMGTTVWSGSPVFYREATGPSAGVRMLTYVARCHDAVPHAPLVRRFTDFRGRVAGRLPGGAGQRRSRERLCTSLISMPSGGRIDWHTDTGPGAPPVIAVLHLSRRGIDFEGGSFQVRTPTEQTVAARAGDVVLFPWDAWHAVTEVTRGERMVLSSGWLKEEGPRTTEEEGGGTPG